MSQILFDTMVDLRNGRIEAREAGAIAAQSNAICRVASVHLSAAKLTGNVKHVNSVAGLLG